MKIGEAFFIAGEPICRPIYNALAANGQYVSSVDYPELYEAMGKPSLTPEGTFRILDYPYVNYSTLYIVARSTDK